jgi:hypothetical protein
MVLEMTDLSPLPRPHVATRGQVRAETRSQRVVLQPGRHCRLIADERNVCAIPDVATYCGPNHPPLPVPTATPTAPPTATPPPGPTPTAVPTATPTPTPSQHDDNGHGNDPGKDDPGNPGKSKGG